MIPTNRKIFTPHAECSASNGGCFEVGRCLMKCQPRLAQVDAQAQLAIAIRLLGVLVQHQRRTGESSPGSNLDITLNEAQCLIERNSR